MWTTLWEIGTHGFKEEVAFSARFCLIGFVDSLRGGSGGVEDEDPLDPGGLRLMRGTVVRETNEFASCSLSFELRFMGGDFRSSGNPKPCEFIAAPILFWRTGWSSTTQSFRSTKDDDDSRLRLQVGEVDGGAETESPSP